MSGMDSLLDSLEDVPSRELSDIDFTLFENDQSSKYDSGCDTIDVDNGIFNQVFTANREKILKLSENKMKCDKYTAIQLVFIGNIIKTIIEQYVEELSGFFRDQELNQPNGGAETVCIGDDMEEKEADKSMHNLSEDIAEDSSDEFLKLSVS